MIELETLFEKNIEWPYLVQSLSNCVNYPYPKEWDGGWKFAWSEHFISVIPCIKITLFQFAFVLKFGIITKVWPFLIKSNRHRKYPNKKFFIWCELFFELGQCQEPKRTTKRCKQNTWSMLKVVVLSDMTWHILAMVDLMGDLFFIFRWTECTKKCEHGANYA